MSKQKIMIIDGNSILNRAFYGLKGSSALATSTGIHTNAIFGFLNILKKYQDEEKPNNLVVAFDLKAPTFRHVEYIEYKANRKGMPEELKVQVPLIKEVLDAMNISRIELAGYEADDLIGTIAKIAERQNFNVVVVTGDRDSFQLVTENVRIKLPKTKLGKTETEEYTPTKIREEYGINPIEFIDLKGLMGDSSDNIPGVPGIGEKTALELIKNFKNLENLYEKIEEISKKGTKEKLIDNKEIAFLSRKLATIELNVPIEVILDDYKVKEYKKDELYNLFKKLEFKSLIEKYKLNKEVISMPLPEMNLLIKKIITIEELINLIDEIKIKREIGMIPFLDNVDKFNKNLVGMSIATTDKNAYFISFNDQISEVTFLKYFKEVFEAENILKFGHDLKNFILYLCKNNIDLNGLGFDTLIAAYVINPARNNSDLSILINEILNLSLPSIEEMAGKGKTFKKFIDFDEEKISTTAANYAVNLYALKIALNKIILGNNQEQLYYEIELPLVKVLAYMEYWGFKINVNELIEYREQLSISISLLTKEIYELTGEEFNINSPKQLGVILFEKLNLPIVKKTKTGYSTDIEVLEQLTLEHPVIKKIIDYRQHVKLMSTYVEGLLEVINPNTTKIHSSFNQTVTITGRISSTEPNLQNIPMKLEMGRKIRKVFIPENKDYILLDADYSQIELRVLAHITNDENMIEAFIKNEDIHSMTAKKVFGVAENEITPLLRSRAKAVNFGIIYGIGEFSLAKDLNISRKEAKKYIEEYLEKYPKVRDYMHNVVAKAKEDGFVKTIFNRTRFLPELSASNFNTRSFGERVALNTPIQGTAADIIKIAMVKIFNELREKNLKSRLILQVHDELLIETAKDEEEIVKEILKRNMEGAVSFKVPLISEVHSGNNWYDLK